MRENAGFSDNKPRNGKFKELERMAQGALDNKSKEKILGSLMV